MKKEIEVKFKIDKSGFVRKKLKEEGAKFLGRALERTIRFDTEKKKLERKGQFLRTRTGFKNVITFKRKIDRKDKKFKIREEIELEISEPKRMELILENLGFIKKQKMEKYREKWRLRDVEIMIDKLPMMGKFVEIEGDEKSIKNVAKILDLNFKERITDTYWGLWKKFTQKKGIKKEDIIFNK